MRKIILIFALCFALLCAGCGSTGEAPAGTCSFSVECGTILNNLDMLDPDKEELVPADGVIYTVKDAAFYEGETVADVTQRILRENKVHCEVQVSADGSVYVEGIGGIYEFDCGPASGWLYSVGGEFGSTGCSSVYPADGGEICWIYTCELGADVR